MGVLESVFRRVAALPLIGPHVNREADLMLAGAKPVAFLWNHSSTQADIKRLDEAVATGRLISRHAQKDINARYSIYAHPGYDEVAFELASLEQSMFMASPNPERQARRQELRNILGLDKINDDGMNVMEKTKLAIARYQRDALKDILPAAAQKAHFKMESIRSDFAVRLLAEGKILAMHIEQSHTSYAFFPETLEKLGHLVKDGTLEHSSRQIKTTGQYMIYGQPGQEENMARLEEMNNLTASRGDPEDNFAKILGYSDRDQDYFANQLNISPVAKLLLDNTNELRRDLRIKMMLQDGPNWNRNP